MQGPASNEWSLIYCQFFIDKHMSFEAWIASLALASGFKRNKYFFPAPSQISNIVMSLRDCDRARISTPVSGGQCHLIHHTIFSKFAPPGLAYMYIKVAKNTNHSFIHAVTHNFSYK